jgi:hypothetical protein
MKRMMPYILMVLGGLSVCGWLVLRHAMRTAVELPNHPQPAAKSPAMDRWQGGIRLDPRTDYAPDPAAKKRLLEKLRQEELRQQPWEGRN